MALPETLAMVQVYARKFDSVNPNTSGARRHLRTGRSGERATRLDGPTPTRNDFPVPSGDWYYGDATTNTQGMASWTVPAGYSWCMHEVTAPPGYQADTAWHCTAVITTATTPATATMALPEVPIVPPASRSCPSPAARRSG